ncbi:MAG: ferritin family protein [Proteobacteria bacterium]|nr:ferritin family protein [Pseudomonadota bacterium]
MTTITARQAIRNAIEAELAASRFYGLLADSTEDAESRAFLAGLAEQEVLHARAIEVKSREIADGPLPSRAEGEVEMIETLPEWRFADGVTLEQALDIAFEAENKASMYYDAFADFFDGPAKEFFVELARVEAEHAAELAKRKQRLS